MKRIVIAGFFSISCHLSALAQSNSPAETQYNDKDSFFYQSLKKDADQLRLTNMAVLCGLAPDMVKGENMDFVVSQVLRDVKIAYGSANGGVSYKGAAQFYSAVDKLYTLKAELDLDDEANDIKASQKDCDSLRNSTLPELLNQLLVKNNAP